MHKVRPVLYYTLGSSVGLSSSSSLSVDPSSLESNKKIGRRQSQFMRDFAFGQGAQDKSSHIHTKNHSSLVLFQTKDKDRHRGELLMMAMATKLATISPGIPETPSNDCTVFDLDKFIHGVLNY